MMHSNVMQNWISETRTWVHTWNVSESLVKLHKSLVLQLENVGSLLVSVGLPRLLVAKMNVKIVCLELYIPRFVWHLK